MAVLAPRSSLLVAHLPRRCGDDQGAVIGAVARFIHADQESHARQYSGQSPDVTCRHIDPKVLTGYRLELTFDNGQSGVVDLSSLAGQGVFAAWEKPGVFEQVSFTSDGAVEWPGELDLCPDALYLRMTGKSPEEVFPALQQP